ncbi:MAG: divergent polysaccharide deacetylase family protein, partial [Rhodospirillales bacterium]
ATLSAATGYIGVATLTGGRFMSNREKLLPIVAAIKERGLMMIDGSAEAGRSITSMAIQAGTPVARADVILDRDPGRRAIDAQLARLEQIVRNNGVAVAVGHPYPSTFERLHNWIALARKAGIDVVPLSALANKQKIL